MSIYSNGKIYKMVNSFGTTYIGSTTQTLAQRRAKHAGHYREHLNGKTKNISTSIKLFIEDPENVDIVLLEPVNCNSKMELHQRERHYIEMLECVNKNIPGRTGADKQLHEKQYKQDNFEALCDYQKDYYILNQEKIKESSNNYRTINKEKVKQSSADYREKNRETINEKKKETVLCVCGAEVTSAHLNRHKKTAKHVKLIEEKELIE